MNRWTGLVTRNNQPNELGEMARRGDERKKERRTKRSFASLVVIEATKSSKSIAPSLLSIRVQVDFQESKSSSRSKCSKCPLQ